MTKYDPRDTFDRYQMVMALGKLEAHIEALDQMLSKNSEFMQMFRDIDSQEMQRIQQLYFDFANAVDTYKMLRSMEDAEVDI